MNDLNSNLAKISPVLSLRLPITLKSAILLRDVIRSEIWQVNGETQLSVNGFDESLKSFVEADNSVSSCGPISYLFAALAQNFGMGANVVSFYWLINGELRGHTANEIYIDDNKVFSDIHSGFLWQSENGDLATAEDIARQLAKPAGEWRFYPSTHGKSSSSNLNGLLKYVFGFWGYDLEAKVRTSCLVNHSTIENQSMKVSSLTLFGNDSEANEMLEKITADTSDAEITRYTN